MQFQVRLAWPAREMLGVNPYITFKGNCRQAIDFYKSALEKEGRLVSVQWPEEEYPFLVTARGRRDVRPVAS